MTFSDSQGKWIKCPHKNTARCNFGFLYCNGYLYAVGGQRREANTNQLRLEDAFERYDISNGKWQKLPRLPCRLNNIPSVAVFSGCIVVGGYSSQNEFGHETGSALHPIMLFNTTTNIWHTLHAGYLGSIHELHVYVKSESMYLITFQKVASKHGTSSPQWLTKPTVYRCECDIKSNPSSPTFSIGYNKPVPQSCVPETNMRVFRLGREVYIILRGHVYKTKVTIADDQVYDADLSSYSAISQIDSDQYAVVTYFNLNKMYIN